MKIQNWTDELRLAVVRRQAELPRDNKIYWEAAQAADGLPVYCDMGGCLVVQSTGRVELLDLDSQSVKKLEDERWLTIACLAAADRYPEFEVVRPTRPNGAEDCCKCSGSGRMRMIDARCGTCWGLGWIRS
jgi:hypothetical protein